MEMNGMKMKTLLVSHILFLSIFTFTSLLLLQHVQCADKSDSLAPSFYTQEIYKELQGLTTTLTRDIKEDLGFCIKDVYVLYIFII
jgi:hypothetical protein